MITWVASPCYHGGCRRGRLSMRISNRCTRLGVGFKTLAIMVKVRYTFSLFLSACSISFSSPSSGVSSTISQSNNFNVSSLSWRLSLSWESLIVTVSWGSGQGSVNLTEQASGWRLVAGTYFLPSRQGFLRHCWLTGCVSTRTIEINS